MQRAILCGRASGIGKHEFATCNAMPAATLLGSHAAAYTAGHVRKIDRRFMAAGIPFDLDAA